LIAYIGQQLTKPTNIFSITDHLYYNLVSGTNTSGVTTNIQLFCLCSQINI